MKNSKIFSINGRKIGPDFPPYIVAEMSGNHNQSIEKAFKLINKAKESGADAIKIQTFTPDTITINHNSPEFFVKGGIWDGRKLYDLYEEAHTPWDWHKKLFEYAKNVGITIFSSPFDNTAIDFLESLDCPAYKIASPEIVDHELIKYAAKTQKPLIISTGMASKKEIHDSIKIARKYGSNEIIVLHCTSSYPTPFNESNLSTMNEIKNSFDIMVGLSDHTEGTLVSSISVSMGAVLVEKHFTIDRKEGGIDSKFSLEPQELKELVLHANIATKINGKPSFMPTHSEKSVFDNRRSIYVVNNILKGEIFSNKNIKSIRPGLGLSPKYMSNVLGLSASRDLKFGEPLELSMISEKLQTNLDD